MSTVSGRHYNFAVSTPTFNELEQVCDKVERLLEVHAQLRSRLRVLAAEVESLRQERDQLAQRIDAACYRVDALIGQLPATAAVTHPP